MRYNLTTGFSNNRKSAIFFEIVQYLSDAPYGHYPLAMAGLSQQDSTDIKGLIADFPDRHLGEVAGTGWDENAFATFLKPTEPPRNLPSGYYAGKNYYVSPLVSLTDRQELISNIEAYQADRPNPPFAVVNYSQDLSQESYLRRVPTGRPVGIPQEQEYVVVTVVNSPGSILQSGIIQTNLIPSPVSFDTNNQLVFGAKSTRTLCKTPSNILCNNYCE